MSGATELLPPKDWRAERCGGEHVIVSVSATSGYRLWTKLPLVQASEPVAPFPGLGAAKLCTGVGMAERERRVIP